jgi:hypothetical protein
MSLATVFQDEAWWKGIPAKSDIRAVLVKVLQKGIRWAALVNIVSNIA